MYIFCMCMFHSITLCHFHFETRDSVIVRVLMFKNEKGFTSGDTNYLIMYITTLRKCYDYSINYQTDFL